MLDWLKFTFGSFVSHKLSKEGASRKVWNVVFSLFLLLLILTTLFSTGLSYSFTTHYVKASKFQEFSYRIFDEHQINLSFAKDDKTNEVYAKAYKGINEKDEVVINSFTKEDDQIYRYHDYNVIIDTRNSNTTFVEFEVRFYLKSNSEEWISFEEYQDSDSKSNYTGKLIPSDKVITINDEMMQKYEKYLSESETLKDQYNQLKEDYTKIDEKTEEDTKNYQNQIYDLYTRSYYGLTLSPTNQYYYQYEYAQFKENGDYKYEDFVIITDDWAMVSFVNDQNSRIVYDGYYNGLEGKALYSIANPDKNYIISQVDLMYTGIYCSVNNMRAMVLFFQLFRYVPIIMIAMLVLSLFLYCFGKIKKSFFQTTYLGYFKITSSFLIGSATLSGIITLILCFIISPQVAVSVGMWVLLSALSIRSIIFVIAEIVHLKRHPLSYVAVNHDDVIDIKDENHFDLSHVEPSSKVVVHDDSDDDDETMELM